MTISINLPECERQVELFKTTLGYDSVRFRHVELSRSGDVSIAVHAEDDFQQSLSWDNQVQHGFILIPLNPKLLAYKSREERELEVLSRQLGELTGLKDAFASAYGKKFVDVLIKQRQEIGALLPKPKAELRGD